MYTHIIVPFDGEEPARRAAAAGADLSRMFDNRLVVVTATPTDRPAEVVSLKERAITTSDERVDVWIESADKPEDAIATVTRHRPQSMVCMATHARRGVRRAVYGSVAEAVVAAVDVPVMLLGPRFRSGVQTAVQQLLICVDGTATSESILPLAAAWARHLALPCVLLHVDTGQRRKPDLPLLASLLERSSPSVSEVRVKGRDVTGAIIERLDPNSHAAAVMASANMAAGRNSNRHGSQVMRVVERSPLPVLVERAGARRAVARA